MCDIVFEKAQECAGKVNIERVFMQKHSSEWFFKKGFMRNFAEFTKKTICAGISFLIKLKTRRLFLII